MTVQLAVGMTAIRRDGERKGPFIDNKDGTFHVKVNAGDDPGNVWHADGSPWGSSIQIIAAGYPRATLAAQVGDTIKVVWNGHDGELWDGPEFVVGGDDDSGPIHPDSLYVIVKTAAKPADPPAIEWGEWVDGPAKWNKRMAGRRMQVEHAGPNVRHRIAKEQPADRARASHKLDLQEGDRVRLDAWQDGTSDYRGNVYEKRSGRLTNVDDPHDFWNLPLTDIPKGERPLFTVLPRAAEQKPDEVLVLHGGNPFASGWSGLKVPNDTQRMTITFPHGSDTGTVVKEAL